MYQKRSPEIEDAILDGLANGISLAALCRKHDISRGAFYLWMRSDPELAERHRVAEAAHADARVDEAIEIADDASQDWLERRDKGDKIFDHEHMRRVRNRSEWRFKAALRIDRKHARKAEPKPVVVKDRPERIDLVALLNEARAKTGVPMG